MIEPTAFTSRRCLLWVDGKSIQVSGAERRRGAGPLSFIMTRAIFRKYIPKLNQSNSSERNAILPPGILKLGAEKKEGKKKRDESFNRTKATIL